MPDSLPRLAPELALPPYAYVPGGPHPHPTRDPAGHSHGRPRPDAEPLEPERWQACRLYLHGIDLFNRGYYWEAHEAWESLWRACERQSVRAAFLKALIALAAAGVKDRQGRPRGVRRHAERAQDLLERVGRCLGPNEPRYLGLELGALAALGRRLAAGEDLAGRTPPRLEPLP